MCKTLGNYVLVFFIQPELTVEGGGERDEGRDGRRGVIEAPFMKVECFIIDDYDSLTSFESE